MNVDNGLANHASACAYGFLLSIVPMLLLITFLFFIVFKPSPAAIVYFFGNIPFLGDFFDSHWLTSDFFAVHRLGLSGIVSILSIYWAGRILALSMQRALAGIFHAEKSRNPVTDTLVTIAFTAVVFILVLLFIFTSRPALRFYRNYPPLADSPAINTISAIFSSRLFFTVLPGVVSFLIYILVPVNSPRKLSAFKSAVLFAFSYFCVAGILSYILDLSRYNFIYGTFGNLIYLLVNVYFFFVLFFICAQYAYVIDSFDALIFIKMRQAKINAKAKKTLFTGFLLKLFDPFDSSLKKYLRQFDKDEIIFARGDSGDEIYYLLDGEVEILLSVDNNVSAGVLKEGSFFGEMGYLLSEDRTATIKAKTDIKVLVLPSVLFDAILKYDKNLDRDMIEHITRRLKITTEQIINLT